MAKFKQKNDVEGDFCKSYRSAFLFAARILPNNLGQQIQGAFEPTCTLKKFRRCLLWDLQRYFLEEDLRPDVKPCFSFYYYVSHFETKRKPGTQFGPNLKHVHKQTLLRHPPHTICCQDEPPHILVRHFLGVWERLLLLFGVLVTIYSLQVSSCIHERCSYGFPP